MSKRKRIKSSILESNSEELRNSPERSRQEEKREISPEDRRKQAERNGRLYIWCVIGVSVALAVFIILRGIVTINEQLTGELDIYDVDITGVDDGTYEGSFSSAHMSAGVSVDIVSGRISAIQLDSYSGIDAQRARDVIERIAYYQTVTPPDESIGSEHSDRIVQRAVMDALSQAVALTAQSRASQALASQAAQQGDGTASASDASRPGQ